MNRRGFFSAISGLALLPLESMLFPCERHLWTASASSGGVCRRCGISKKKYERERYSNWRNYTFSYSQQGKKNIEEACAKMGVAYKKLRMQPPEGK